MDIFRKIKQVRLVNKNKIWLVHISVVVIVFLSSYIPNIEFVVIPRVLSVLYLLVCICYNVFVYSNKKKECLRYLYVFWCIAVHSLVFFTIEIEEKGFTYFALIVLLNILLCLFSFFRDADSVGTESDLE
jgi:hypothetical protein